MKNRIQTCLLFILLFSQASFSQSWSKALIDHSDNPNFYEYGIHELPNGNTLIAASDQLITLDVSGNIIDQKFIDFVTSPTTKRFTNDRLLDFTRVDTTYRLKIFDFDGNFIDSVSYYQGARSPKIDVMDNDHFIFLTSTNDPLRALRKYNFSGDIIGEYIFDNNLSSFPSNLTVLEDGNIFCYSGLKIWHFDTDLNLIKQIITPGQWEIDQPLNGPIYIAGRTAEKIYIASIEDDGSIIDSIQFNKDACESSWGCLPRSLDVINDKVIMTVVGFENDGNYVLYCMDLDLQSAEIFTIPAYGTHPIARPIANNIGGVTIGLSEQSYIPQPYSLDRDPLIIKMDDNCFFDDDIVLGIEECILNTTQKENGVLLKWELISNRDFEYLDLEHRTQEGSFRSFETIELGSIAANNFSFLHLNPLNGSNFYRLKFTDVYGENFYSNIVTQSFDKGDVISISPNPVTDLLTIKSNQEIITMSILNSSGKRVHHVEKLDESEWTIDISYLQKAWYIIELQTSSDLQHIPFIKI